MSEAILIAANSGLYKSEKMDNQWQVTESYFDGDKFTCVDALADLIIAGTTTGIYRSEDRGKIWQPVDLNSGDTHLRWIKIDPDNPSKIFAGTEPAEILVSNNHGTTWNNIPEVAQLRNENRWMLPYSPEAGCVRGFAVQKTRGYAAVEVGGLLWSDDGGASWRLVEGSDGQPSFGRPKPNHIHPDVHSIHLHPTNPDLLFAPTGGGLYSSQDGGKIWELRYDCYCRALWWDPENLEHLIFGPADGVGRGGRIEESQDGGNSWRPISEENGAPWSNTMPERFSQSNSEIFCVLDDGRLLVSSTNEQDWNFILPDLLGINAVAADKFL